LTDKHQSDHIKEWKSAQKPSHNIDSRIVDVLRFLARRSAEQDYKNHLKSTTCLTQKPESEE